MKKIALVLLCVVGTACAVFYYFTITTDEPVIQVASQQDTEVDIESSRDTFEYFLSGLGEADLNALKQHFQNYNNQLTDAFKIDSLLFDKFIRYKSALKSLDPIAFDRLDLASLHQINDRLILLQQRFFTPEKQAQLFGEENQLRSLALRQLELRHQAADQQDYQNQWQQEMDNLPPAMKESYRNAEMLSQLQSTRSLDPQERFLANQELVGTEAATRLEILAEKRAAFQQRLAQFLKQRAVIQADENLTIEAKQSAIDELRNNSFSENQQRRVQALESIHDEQNAQSHCTPIAIKYPIIKLIPDTLLHNT